MAEQDAAALARATHEAFNNRDFERTDDLVTGDLEWTNAATGETFHGPEGWKQFELGWANAFPDAATEITGLYTGEDFAVIEFVGRGTHEGVLKSPAGEIPATGRRIEVSFCEVYRIRDGKLAGGAIYFDLVTMMAQLGLMPAPEGAEA